MIPSNQIMPQKPLVRLFASAAARVNQETASRIVRPTQNRTKILFSRELLSKPNGFESSLFKKEEISLAGKSEWVVRGGRHLFPAVAEAFSGIKQIGVLGWGSQGPAQAQNLRDTLTCTNSKIRVVVGLQAGSKSADAARASGFTESNGTLADIDTVAKTSDLNLLLISDAGQVEKHQHLFSLLRSGSTLGLSHGFLHGHLKAIGSQFPTDIDVIGVCPKGMGPSVRRLYVQGIDVNGAGINSSFAVEQNVTGRAVDVALGWAVGLGSPWTFQTTLEAEYKSDIFGERGVLLGGVHGMCEALWRYYVRNGVPEQEAYRRTAMNVTGPISSLISGGGLKAVATALTSSSEAKDTFRRAYCAAYEPCMEILKEIYDEVCSGRELESVVDSARRISDHPLGQLNDTPMWRAGQKLPNRKFDAVDPLTAGVYVAMMTAQCDLLGAAGHSYSEIANESIIEAVDSLNPYMAFKGVGYMVDNCSLTARLGARKWAPRFDYNLEQKMLNAFEKTPVDQKLISDFENNPIHSVLDVCSAMRPVVDISPCVTHLG